MLPSSRSDDTSSSRGLGVCLPWIPLTGRGWLPLQTHIASQIPWCPIEHSLRGILDEDSKLIRIGLPLVTRKCNRTVAKVRTTCYQGISNSILLGNHRCCYKSFMFYEKIYEKNIKNAKLPDIVEHMRAQLILIMKSQLLK